jgi:hypothetical protein
MTVEEAIEEYPWRVVSGDARTPQSMWSHKYLTNAEKEGEDRYRRQHKIEPRNWQKTNMAQDGVRIRGILTRAGNYTPSEPANV